AVVYLGVFVGGAGAAVTPGWECVPTAAGQAVVSGGTGSAPSCGAGTTAVLAPTYVPSGVGGKPTVKFAAVNVQILNGAGSTASGSYATVTGGQSNAAKGTATSVTGGYANTAAGGYSDVTGGCSNIAGTGTVSVNSICEDLTGHPNAFAAVTGGVGNQASAN